MKKTLLFFFLSITTFIFAQNIPTEKFEQYRTKADSLFRAEQYSEAINIYTQLAFSCDTMSCKQLQNIFSKGLYSKDLVVEKDTILAKRWEQLVETCTRDRKIGTLRSNEKSEQVSSESENTIEHTLKKSGELIEWGGHLKNMSITFAAIGSVLGGTIAGIGSVNGASEFYVVGGVIAGGMGIAALIMDIMGNNKIKEGGRILRNVQLQGNGIKVTF